MRISTEQNILRSPLNGLLGSKANIRLLRVLSHEVGGEPLTGAEAARRAGLTAVGARKALTELVRGGFVVRVGGGRTRQYELRANDPLLSALRVLFSEEQVRYDTFLSHLREVFVSIPELRSAWIDKMPTRLGQALEIAVVTEAKAIPWIREELRAQLLPLEGQFDQVMEIAIFTRADAPNMRHDALALLAGALPNEKSWPHSAPISQSSRNERALRLSRSIAEVIRTNPSIIKRAQRHLARLIHEGPGTATADLLEWRQILETYSPERVREFLVSTTSRAIRLRQSSPFFAVLTSDEQDAVMSEYEAEK